MEELAKKLVAVVSVGFVVALFLAVLWVVLWTVTLPSVFPSLTWDGHDALTVPIFVLSWSGVSGMGLLTLFRY